VRVLPRDANAVNDKGVDMKSLFRSIVGARRGLRVGAVFSLVVATMAMVAGLALVASPAGADASGDLLSFATPPTSGTAGSTTNVVVDVQLSGGGNDLTSSDLITLTAVPSIPAGDWGPTTATASSGVATFSNFHINKAGGPYTITASDTTTPAVTNTNVSGVSVSPAVQHQLAFTTEPPTSTTGAFSTVVGVEDAYGNLTTSTNTIVLSTTSTGCALSGTTSVAAVNGSASFSGLTLTGATNQGCILTATDNTDNTVNSANSSAISELGAASKLVFTTEPPTAATFGVDMSPTFQVSIEDANGNVENTGAAATDSISLAPSAGCSLTNTTATASAGVASFATSYFTAGSSCTLTASDTTRGGITTATSTTIAVSSNAPAKLGFSTEPPTTSAAGALLTTFKVSTEQGNGIPVTSGSDTTDTVSITSTCKLLGTTSAAEVAGVATFSNVSIQSSGTCTLVATDASTSLIASATSTSILMTASTPTHVVFTTAPPTTDGSLTAPLTSFAVSVEDVYGNVTSTTTGSTDVITLTSNCTLAGTTSVAAVAGVATFSAVTITTPGACVLTATDTTRAITTATANVQVGTPQATLSVSSLKGYLGTPLQLTTSGGSGTGAVTFTVVNGTATGCTISGSTLTATKVGTCIVTATKAAAMPYAAATSAAATVAIGPAFRLIRLVGTVYLGRTQTVKIDGTGFAGKPRLISNAVGFSARVTHDTGTVLTVIITVSARNHAGTHVITGILADGRRSTMRFTLR
jgi:hypothetical protein